MNRDLRHTRGQAAVEMALTLPIVLLIVLGIMEGGWLMFVYGDITTAGREAARYGAGIGTNGVNGAGTVFYNDCDGIKAAAVRIGQYAGVTADKVHLYHDTGPNTTQTPYCSGSTDTVTFVQGDRVVVKIDTSYTPITPIGILPTITLHSDNAHSILVGAAVVAVPQTFTNPAEICDASKYSITKSISGLTDTITIKNTGGPATSVVSILVYWDAQSNTNLTSIVDTSNNPLPGLTGLPNSSGFFYSPVSIPFTNPTTKIFKINFSKAPTNVFVQVYVDTPANCHFEVN